MENGRRDEVVRLVVWQKLFREDANWGELASVLRCASQQGLAADALYLTVALWMLGCASGRDP